MHIRDKSLDLIFLFSLILTIVGLPFGIRAYDRQVWKKNIPSGAKEFTLTGHAQRGWLMGEVQAYDVISLWQ
jgi:hypothetical protein